MAVVAENAIRTGDHQFGNGGTGGGDREAEYRSDVKKLVDLLSKLNPMAKEFVPSSRSDPEAAGGRKSGGHRLSADAPVFVSSSAECYSNGSNGSSGGNSNMDSLSDGSTGNQGSRQYRRRNNGYSQGRRRMSERDRRLKEDCIRRTVYVSHIDSHVTEELLAELFSNCGKVNDCRVCGDPHSVLRFAFIEFADDYGARRALNLGGTILGYYPVRVLPSKTAILPVNHEFLPKSEDEKEMVTRTVYCTNIDKKVDEIQVTQTDVKVFFEMICGEVSRLRLLGDHVHSTRIAFVEFAQAESAIQALNCSGMLLGSLPIRVSPSKTPVRPRVPRAAVH